MDVALQPGSGNGILENSIYSNTLVGIDLAPGAHKNQSAPVLTSAQTLADVIQVSGTLTSAASTQFTIEFFAKDVSKAGGQYFLGSLKVKTNRFGVATFTFEVPLPPVGASFITATATDPKHNTSEFSGAVS